MYTRDKDAQTSSARGKGGKTMQTLLNAGGEQSIWNNLRAGVGPMAAGATGRKGGCSSRKAVLQADSGAYRCQMYWRAR